MKNNMLRLSHTQKPIADIKMSPEDFLVEEITEKFRVLNLNERFSKKDLGIEVEDNDKNVFCMFVMQKREWNTVQALKEIAKKVRRSFKSVGFAGTKDRNAITTQLCSIYGADPEEVQRVSIKDIKINCTWKVDYPIHLGELEGNRFHVSMRNVKGKLEDTYFNKYKIFPNYFGKQRFGSRNNNVSVGLRLLKGEFEKAAMTFLVDTNNELNQEAIDARTRLEEERDFEKALQYFPKYLKYERVMINYLSKFEGNYANALRRLPRQLLMMFVHSVEGYIFNRSIEERIGENRINPEKGEQICRVDGYGFPDYKEEIYYSNNKNDKFILGNIIGYDTKKLSELEKSVLDELNISVEDFNLKKIPEIRCKGARRVMFAPFKNFEYNDINKTMKFDLPSGSYATIFLNEFINFK